MRDLCLVTGAVCLLAGLTHAEEMVADSEITAVWVYPDRARVMRTVELEGLETGRQEVKFEHLPASIEEGTVKASGEGTARVKILGVELKKKMLEEASDERVREYEREIEGLNDEMARLNDEIAVIQGNKAFLEGIKVEAPKELPKDVRVERPGAEEWEAIYGFLGEEFGECVVGLRDLEFEKRALGRKTDKVNRELNELRARSRKEEKEITVALEAMKEGDLDLNVSYVLPGASWEPVYDARVDEGKEEVELTYGATIRQSTGEDWEDVALTLSTARPAISGRMPDLQAWYLKSVVPVVAEGEGEGVPLAGLSAGRAGGYYDAQLGTDFDLGANYAGLALFPVERSRVLSAPAEQAVARAEEKGMFAVFEVKKKESIPSDNQPHKTTVAITNLSGDFSYQATPKASEHTYLSAKVRNEEEYPFLAGQINVFLGDDYVGKSSLDTVASSEEFDLFLGADENVRVSRELTEEKTGEAKFFGKTVRKEYGYKIEVENYKGSAQRVTVIDHIPVSKEREIEVKMGKVEPAPDGQDEKGMLKWHLEVQPGEKQEIRLEYTVEYPKDKVVPGV